MHLQFVYPWILYVLWLVLAIGLGLLFVYRRKENRLEKLLSPVMQKKLCPRSQPIRFYWQWILMVAGLLLTIFALARPQWGMKEEKTFQRGRDLIIALDVSRSMLAKDVHPNRLQRAKADIMDLIRQLRGDRAGLIVFRRQAIQLCPLTTDYAFLEQVLDDVTIESAPRGQTNIGDAIDKAIQAFETDAGSYKAIILISDGEDLTGLSESASEKAKKKGIVVFTIGLGDSSGSTIPDAKTPGAFMTYHGKKVITRLEHKTLKKIAEITGGVYVPVGRANVKLGKLYGEHLSKLAARDIEESIQRQYIDRYQFFLFPAILFFLTACFLSRGRLATGRRQQKPAEIRHSPQSACLSSFLCLSGTLIVFSSALLPSTATDINSVSSTNSPATNATEIIKPVAKPALDIPAGRAGARIAQKLYQLGKYGQSAEAYLKAKEGANEELQNHLMFNAGCALYKDGQYESAAQKFSELAKGDKMDPVVADYNLGCAAYQLAESTLNSTSNRYSKEIPLLLERSGKAFQRALLAKPDNQAARENLAVITNTLPGARKKAKIQALMEKYGKSQPFQLADEMLKNQRDINKCFSEAISNTTPAKINLFENLSAREKLNADILIPLTPMLATAISTRTTLPATGQQPTQQQLASLAEYLEALGNVMHEASEKLRDLDDGAGNSTTAAESGTYNLWKGIAPYAPLLYEDIYRQTNNINMTMSVLSEGKDESRKAIQNQQNESIELTDLFIKRFSQAFPKKDTSYTNQGAMAQDTATDTNRSAAVTNKPQITAETRTNILDLAHQAKTCQMQASKLLEGGKIDKSLTSQQKSYKLLKEIEKLLPKDKNKRQKQKQKDQQKQEQQKEEQEKKPQEGEKEQKEPQPKPEPEHQPEQKSQEQPSAQKQEKTNNKEMTPEQAKALLEKAQEREKEHKKEKMRRSYIPMSPVDKDW